MCSRGRKMQGQLEREREREREREKAEIAHASTHSHTLTQPMFKETKTNRVGLELEIKLQFRVFRGTIGRACVMANAGIAVYKCV